MEIQWVKAGGSAGGKSRKPSRAQNKAAGRKTTFVFRGGRLVRA